MVKFLISTAFLGARLIRGDAYFDLSSNDAAHIRGRFLFDVRHLLEKIRYFWKVSLFCHVTVF